MKLKQIKKITVIGGGNIGTFVACVCAHKDYDVTVYTPKADAFDKEIVIVNSDGDITCQGILKNVTGDMEEAMDTDLIFITYPAFMFPDLAKAMMPYVKPGMIIGSLPGTGGVEFIFKKCIEKGTVLFGFQRVPVVARLVEYGRKVWADKRKDSLFVASLPDSYSEEISDFIVQLFDMECHPLKNYLSVTMTPSNPILHTSRLATLFEDYKPGVTYERNPLFYGEWSDKSSERLLECDAEHQRILAKLDRMDLSDVKSLILHYDNSDTAEKMTKKLSSIMSLHELSSPMKKTADGWIPDFSSRYFTADFPFGLSIIEEIAEIAGVEVPMINKTMQWYRDVTGNTKRFEISGFGINSKEDLYDFYLKN